jgi:hypothetical protein
VISEQVEMGVAVRMAVLDRLSRPAVVPERLVRPAAARQR